MHDRDAFRALARCIINQPVRGILEGRAKDKDVSASYLRVEKDRTLTPVGATATPAALAASA